MPDKQQLRKRSLETEARHLSRGMKREGPVSREARRSSFLRRAWKCEGATMNLSTSVDARELLKQRGGEERDEEESTRNISIPRKKNAKENFRLAFPRQRSLAIVQDYHRVDVIQLYYSFLKRILQIRVPLIVIRSCVYVVNLSPSFWIRRGASRERRMINHVGTRRLEHVGHRTTCKVVWDGVTRFLLRFKAAGAAPSCAKPRLLKTRVKVHT